MEGKTVTLTKTVLSALLKDASSQGFARGYNLGFADGRCVGAATGKATLSDGDVLGILTSKILDNLYPDESQPQPQA